MTFQEKGKTGMNRCWTLGDNINTDDITPHQYQGVTDLKELAVHVFENLKPGFAAQLKQGDILVCGDNFGYGSSRERAPQSLIGAGIEAIIAKSFARIFYRNCINVGLPVITCIEAVDHIVDGDDITLDIDQGIIENVEKGAIYRFQPFPLFLQEILSSGGLIHSLNKKRERNLVGGGRCNGSD
ncbi:MAG: 3-isopropylmalate dehydratase small subunit [Synergistaceae bacterium]|nr:3-isopropylmalate dehydratase small subunit [Synergistaceae bacterium]